MKANRKMLLVGVGLIVVITVTIVVRLPKTVRDIESAGVQAKDLIAKVGGPIKVCDEANQMFRRFNVSNVKFFHDSSELKDYPAIAALARPDRISIYSGSPPYIAIRIGSHFNGFTIEIVDTNNPTKYVKSAQSLEIVDSCVFVHR
jgi:hypothetical protein